MDSHSHSILVYGHSDEDVNKTPTKKQKHLKMNGWNVLNLRDGCTGLKMITLRPSVKHVRYSLVSLIIL